jgi:ubiquinone biosynthesis protein UbiJ
MLFWNPHGQPPSGLDFPQAPPEEELQYLKEEEEMLSQDMKNLKKRIEELEKKSKK